MFYFIVLLFNFIFLIKSYHLNRFQIKVTNDHRTNLIDKTASYKSKKHISTCLYSKIIEVNDINEQRDDNKQYIDEVIKELSNILDPDDGVDIIESNM